MVVESQPGMYPPSEAECNNPKGHPNILHSSDAANLSRRFFKALANMSLFDGSKLKHIYLKSICIFPFNLFFFA